MNKKIIIFIVLFITTLSIGSVLALAATQNASVNINATIPSSGAVCGNGAVETGEACDDGAGNGACPAACSSACTVNNCGGSPPIPLKSCNESCILTSECAAGLVCYSDPLLGGAGRCRNPSNHNSLTCECSVNTCSDYGYFVGDVNGDGCINLFDASQVQVGSLDQEPAEINGDLIINNDDAAAITSYYSGGFVDNIGDLRCYAACPAPPISCENEVGQYIVGDVNNDGYVTIKDALRVKAYLNGQFNLSGLALKAADVDLNSVVDEDDVNFIYHNNNANICQTVCGPQVLIKFYAKPEKRKPFNNPIFTMPGMFEIRKTGTTEKLAEISFETNDDGYGEVEVPAVFLPNWPGDYDIAVKGISHLRKVIGPKELIIDEENNVDFTSSLPFFLIAGDVQFQKDNYINALDLAAIEWEIYTDDIDADLDWNGTINGLDLNIAEFNIYKSGDN